MLPRLRSWCVAAYMLRPLPVVGLTPCCWFGLFRYQNVIQTVKLVMKEEGLAGMYGGMAVHLMRTVPNAAIMFMIVEALTDVGV